MFDIYDECNSQLHFYQIKEILALLPSSIDSLFIIIHKIIKIME